MFRPAGPEYPARRAARPVPPAANPVRRCSPALAGRRRPSRRRPSRRRRPPGCRPPGGPGKTSGPIRAKVRYGPDLRRLSALPNP